MLSTRLEQHENVLRLRLSGRFDASTAPVFVRGIEQMLALPAKGECIVNFADVNYIDSRGLGLLIFTRSRLAKENRQLVLESPTAQVLQAFKMANFKRLFEVRLAES